MIWYLVCRLISISYRLTLNFVPLEWFLWKLWPLEIENFMKMWVFRTFSGNAYNKWFWYLVCRLVSISYRSSVSFVLLEWFLWKLWSLEIENCMKISVFHTFYGNASSKLLDIWYVHLKRWVTDQVSTLSAKPKGTVGFCSVRLSVSQSVSLTCFPHFFLMP